MRLTIHALLTLLCLTPAATRADESVRAQQPATELRYQRGDDPRWAAPDWDDHDWPRAAQDGLTIPVDDGIYWVRFRIQQTEVSAAGDRLRTLFWPRDEPGSPINAIFIAGPMSFELHWDGRLIWRSGVVGADRASETPGPLDNLVPVPDERRGPGPHTVALRISTAHYNFTTTRAGFYFAMVNFAERLIYETRQPILPLVGAGTAMLAAVFCAILFWLVDRRRPLLLCTLLSVAVGVFYFLIAWRWLHNDPYDWFAPRLTAIAITVTAFCGLQAWLLLEQFALPRKLFWLAALAPLIVAAWLASPFHAVIVLWIFRATLAFSVVATGWAVARRRIGARWALAAALLGLCSLQLVGDSREFVSGAFLLTFGAQLLGLFIALGLQVSDDRRRAREVALTAVRLETELLKKNLQPHFLLNTLATIIEVIEQEPKTAVTLIEALAREFRILARVAGEKLIPLGHELELCRAHLRIMSLRKGAACSLAVGERVDELGLVPPALFHTLVENGLTHLLPRDGEQRFELSEAREATRRRYTLVAHGDPMDRARPPTLPPLAGTPAPGVVAPATRREGTGLRYVKARLEESFPGRWSLRGEAIPEGWRTVIEIAAFEQGDRV
jgi:hypothetical protein